MMNKTNLNNNELLTLINEHPVFSGHMNEETMKDAEALICQYFCYATIAAGERRISFLDYADTALEAIRRSIRAYNNEKGTPMSYIYSAVRNALLVEDGSERFLESHGGVRLNAHQWSIVNDMKKNPNASDAEIASMGTRRTAGMTKNLRDFTRSYDSLTSLDLPAYDDSTETYADYIADETITDARIMDICEFEDFRTDLFRAFDAAVKNSRQVARDAFRALATEFCLSHMTEEDQDIMRAHVFYSGAAEDTYRAQGNKLSKSEIAAMCGKSGAAISHAWQQIQACVALQFNR